MAEQVIAIIPARLGSTRLPRKPLVRIHGKPLIQWVYENAKRFACLDEVLLATDSAEVAEVARGFGAAVVMTGSQHLSGTDRVAEVAQKLSAPVIVNLQGDEPLIREADVVEAIEWVKRGRFKMATMATPLQNEEDRKKPQVVKVVVDASGKALDFTRQSVDSKTNFVGHHMGVYVFDRSFLLEFTKWSQHPREQEERLEQLRALMRGADIGVSIVASQSFGIDTPEDVEKAARLLVSIKK